MVLPLFGLKNTHQNCYLNSVIQVLLRYKPLFLYCKQFYKNENFTSNHDTFLYRFSEICFKINESLNILSSSKKPIVINNKLFIKLIKDSKTFRLNRQEDASEFLVNFIDNILTISKPYSHIHKKFKDIFYNSLYEIITCTSCKFTKHKNIHETIIHIDDYNLSPKMFDTEYEQLEGYKCENCSTKNTSFKTLKANKMSDLIIFTLNRYTPENKKKLIKIPEIIEFDNNQKYMIYAIILHHGNSIKHGHYTCLTQPLLTYEWFHFDDENASQILTNSNIFNMLLKNSYILFYRKINENE